MKIAVPAETRFYVPRNIMGPSVNMTVTFKRFSSLRYGQNLTFMAESAFLETGLVQRTTEDF